MTKWLSAWNTFVTTFGFNRKQKYSRSRDNYGRRLRFEQCEDRRLLAVLTVTTPLDNTIGGDGLLTLREAVDAANFAPDHDTIIFDPAVFTPGNNTITLDLGNPLPNAGKELYISEQVTIDASMLTAGLTINAGGGLDGVVGNADGSRVFLIALEVAAGLDEIVTLKGLTITGGDPNIHNEILFPFGSAAGNGGGIFFDTGVAPGGSGVEYLAKLIIEDSTIINNYSEVDGGGLHADSIEPDYPFFTEVEIIGSTFKNNRSDDLFGGGAYIGVNGARLIKDSKFIDNETSGSGGGVYVEFEGQPSGTTGSLLEIENSEFIGNKAFNTMVIPNSGGGGINVQMHAALTPDVSIVNTTVANNVAYNSEGGGLRIDSNGQNALLEITNSTISGNHAPDSEGGGLWVNSRESNFDNLTVNLNHVTITENVSGTSGGGLASPVNGSVQTTLSHTIVSGNKNSVGGANNIFGQIESTSSYNLIGPGDVTAADLNIAGTGNRHDTDNDPDLFPLGNYGGPTLTHLPEATSEAVNNGNLNITGQPVYDQRGNPFDRVAFGQIDIGAVEFGDPTQIPAPRVSTVIISKSDAPSNSLSPSYDFNEDTYFNSATGLAEPLDGSGNQLRTVPVGGAETVSIVFDQPVNVSIDDLGIIGLGALGTVNEPMLVQGTPDGFDYDEATFTAKWTYDAPFASDFYVIKLADGVDDGASAGVTSATPSAKRIDGEWTNPGSVNVAPGLGVSEFPSGNNSAGGDFTFVFTIFAGDTDQNNIVDLSDVINISPNFGIPGTFGFVDGDFNGDTVVDLSDVILLSPNFEDELIDLIMAVDTDGDNDFDQEDINWYAAHDPTNALYVAFEELYDDIGAIEINVV